MTHKANPVTLTLCSSPVRAIPQPSARRAVKLTNPWARKGPSILRTFFRNPSTQPAAIRRPQPSGRSPVNPHTIGVSKDISTNPRLIHLPRLPDYMTREAKRPGEGSFQFPRCTIHGSGKERLGAFMNFSSPARRKLHKNS